MSKQRFVTDEEAELLELFDHLHTDVALLVKSLNDAIYKGSKQPLTEAAFAAEFESFMTDVEKGIADKPSEVVF